MDIYHGWCDLKPGVSDTAFADAFSRYMAHLKREGKIESARLTRRKLGLGPKHLAEFHFMIETRDMAHTQQIVAALSAAGFAARRL